MSTRGKVRERKGNDLCRITSVNLPFNAQIGQLLVRPISAFSRPFSLNRNESCCTRNRRSHRKFTNYLDYLQMLFDKVLSQKFDTDIWRATTTSAHYSAEVIFLFSAFGIPNNRVDTDNLTLGDHNNICGVEKDNILTLSPCKN